MDYNKLADLLYEDAKEVADIEKKYPSRNLNIGAEVTRFAPSPTGYMHIGHFFGALIDRLIAKDNNGIFYFRLEDTDKKREVSGADLVALNTLKQFGIIPDEGLMADGSEVGKYGPYTQSKRLENYHAFAKKLVREGKAFPCFCEKSEGKEDILKRREEELEGNDAITEKDPCRDLTFEQIQQKIKEGKNFALRLKSSGDGEKTIKVFDLIKGERELPANSKDVVLVKSNGIPPYTFAHPVDDHLMKTTVVVRGEEWFPSLPAHIEIFEALGAKPPKYLHTPLLCKIGENGNKRKLSKRLDKESDMRYFVKDGYPKEAVIEYLYNLINSSFEPWRKENPDAKLEEYKFDIGKMGSSSPLFDMVKFNDISKNIISKMTAENVYENYCEWAKEFDEESNKILNENRQFFIQVFGIDRNTEKPRKDIFKWGMVKDFYLYFFFAPTEYELLDSEQKDFKEVCEHYIEIYNDADDKETWFNKIKQMAENLGYAIDNKAYKQNPENFKGNVAKVCEYIRVAITGRKNSLDLYSISKVLGHTSVIKRLSI